MASANVPVENPFLTQIERVRVELRERVARAHQVLQERETALLSELQQLEDTYRGEGVGKQIDQLRISKRRAWENGEALPDTEGEMPDFQYGLLHQKLQMLQCCIRHKGAAFSPRPTLGTEVKFFKEEGLVHIGSPGTSDSDEFYEASDGLPAPDSEGEDPSLSLFQSCSPMEGSGRQREAGKVLMITGDPMYIPVTQEHAPLTEDALRAQTELMSQLVCSQEASFLRATMQSVTLRSDMSAFKAANPGCVLEDFIRWYSPRDFIPLDSSFSSMELQSPLEHSYESALSSLDTPTNNPADTLSQRTQYLSLMLMTHL